LADYLDLKTAWALLDYAEWRDDDQYNDQKRIRLKGALSQQILELEPIVERYIADLTAPRGFDLEHWNDV
jgi:hypothetical protein